MVTIEQIHEYMNKIRKAYEDRGVPYGPPPVLHFHIGNKYIKIMKNQNGSIHVHCFIEKETGDLYKAAAFNHAAKGARGNIADEKPPILLADFYKY